MVVAAVAEVAHQRQQPHAVGVTAGIRVFLHAQPRRVRQPRLRREHAITCHIHLISHFFTSKLIYNTDFFTYERGRAILCVTAGSAITHTIERATELTQQR